MIVHEITTKDGNVEKVLIPGSEDMSRSQLQEILEWSKQNSERQALEREQRARYRKIPAIEAFREMKRFRRWVAGEGRMF